MMKRIIALLLALILTVGLLPTVALAAEGGETPTTGTGDVKNGYYEVRPGKRDPSTKASCRLALNLSPRPRNRPRTLTSTKSRWRLS